MVDSIGKNECIGYGKAAGDKQWEKLWNCEHSKQNKTYYDVTLKKIPEYVRDTAIRYSNYVQRPLGTGNVPWDTRGYKDREERRVGK